MTRRQFSATLSQAAFPGTAYRDYSRTMPDYLRRLAQDAYQRRNRALAAITTPAAARSRQQWARETFWKLTGGMPQRTPLNAKVTGRFERDTYSVEKVLFESQPGYFVSANLYIPKGATSPLPGVLFQMGHSPNGKAADTYQRCCQGLVQLGFLVFAFDPMGQGERLYYPNAGPTAQHDLAGKDLRRRGQSASQVQVWDAVRALDYLAAHPLVDPKRLASTGQSGGGTLTMLLAAVDDRLTCAAVASGNTENFACADFNAPGSTDDYEQNFLDSGPAAFDRWDLLYPLAPKPLLISVSDKDWFGTYSPRYISSGWEEFQKLKKFYRILGAADKLQWADTPLPHGLSYDSRLNVYNFLLNHLAGKPPVAAEPPVKVEEERTLWVTESGKVPGKPLPPGSPARDPEVRPLRPKPALKPITLRRVPSRGIHIEAIEIESEPGIFLPAWLFLPDKPDPSKPVLVSLESNGRTRNWHEGERYPELALAGQPVCVPDLRLIGDLAPEFGRGSRSQSAEHNTGDAWERACLILGKPLQDQWITDILAVLAAIRNHPECRNRPVTLTANGKLVKPAEQAAKLDGHVEFGSRGAA